MCVKTFMGFLKSEEASKQYAEIPYQKHPSKCKAFCAGFL